MAFPYYSPTYQYPNSQQTYPQNGIIWIAGEQEAQTYPVAPNNAVTLWSQTEPVVYLKQADASGRPALKAYDLVERTETARAPQQGNVTEYATKRDLAAFNAVIDALKTDIESMRGDLYGLAGKKRTAKKTEKEEDDE